MKTRRLYTCPFSPEMAETVHRLSIEADNRKFMTDEVFETVEDALSIIRKLAANYTENKSPLVYPLFLREGDLEIGHIEIVALGESGEWEIGYHIGNDYCRCGYAVEAVRAFTPLMAKRLGLKRVWGICREDNPASARVLELSGYTLAERGNDWYQGVLQPVRKYVYTMPETNGIPDGQHRDKNPAKGF